MDQRPLLSVVVCFKDWGLDRLIGVTESILDSRLGTQVEVVIADYGSSDSEGYKEALEETGAKYYYFETDGVWSRSRALNLGASKCRGKYIITTDADMIFSPTTFPKVLELLEKDPYSYYIVQCRDLPEGITHNDVLSGKVSFETLESISQLRPRWGMGGLIAFTRIAYDQVRGLDERLQVYGGEDIDLAKRLMRIGLRRIWIDDPAVRMFHVWHPSSLAAAEETKAGKAAVDRNRNVHKNDPTTVRNVEHWLGKSGQSKPLVTVAISTFNRASFLRECLESVFAQSFRDFEVVVVNDGSTDSTADILASIEDPRLRVVHQENQGLAAARNRITELANGHYIAVHDDDDLMLPDRLKNQLECVGDGVNGSYGGWIDFDDASGDLVWNRGKSFSLDSLAFNSGVYLHPTLLVEKTLMEAVPYDQSMRSGSDYNLAVRLARSGANLKHCGRYVILRRGHDDQITNLYGQFQKASGRISGALARASFGPMEKEEAKKERPRKDWVKVEDLTEAESRLKPYLPDHLVERGATILLGDDEAPIARNIPGFSLFEVAGEWITPDRKMIQFEGDDIDLSTVHQLHAHFGNRLEVYESTSQPLTAVETGDEFELIVMNALSSLSEGKYSIFEFIGRIPPSLDVAFSTAIVKVFAQSNEMQKFYILASEDSQFDLQAVSAQADATWNFERRITQ